MKALLPFLLCALFTLSLRAEEPVTVAATLEIDGQTITTPLATFTPGMTEAIRRVSLKQAGRKYTFALKSSATRVKGGQIAYAISLSLADAGEDDFSVSMKGTAAFTGPLKLSVIKDGTEYPVTVVFN